MAKRSEIHMHALSVVDRACRAAIEAVREDQATDRDSRRALNDLCDSIERVAKAVKLRARQHALRVATLRGETEQQIRARLWREALDASAEEQQRELLDSVGL